MLAQSLTGTWQRTLKPNPTTDLRIVFPSDPNAPGRELRVLGDRMVTRNASLNYLIAFAYDLQAKQISAGPAWLDSEKYDINAKPDVEGQPSLDQLRSMTRKLLADRFQLTFHKAKKELSAYAMTAEKTAAKLTKSEGDPNGLPTLRMGKLGAALVRNVTITDFAAWMQTSVLDWPVVDQTGLAGKFYFTIDWTPEASQFGGRGGQAVQPGADDPAAPPDLLTAMVAQLGLRLESAKLP